MAERKKVKQIKPRQKPKATLRGGQPQKGKSSAKAASKKMSKSSSKKFNQSSANRRMKSIPMSSAVELAGHKSNSKTSKSKVSSTDSLQKKSKKSVERKTTSRLKNGGTKTPALHMEPRKNTLSSPQLTLLLGNKPAVRRKRLITAVIFLVVIGVIVAFCAVSPTGPFEKIVNSVAMFGGGKFPASVTGNEANRLIFHHGKISSLSNSHMTVWNRSGKELLNVQHNFSNPVLEVSKERSLIYNRESTGLLVTNNVDVLWEENVKHPIFTADIADNGSVAVVTKSSGYAAQVQVFSKNKKQKFIWYLVDGLISDVVLSDNGKYLAVSVIRVKEGRFSSQIYGFHLRKEDPIFSLEKKDLSIISLEAISNNSFAAVSNESLSFLSFKNGSETPVMQGEGAPTFFRVNSEGIYGVWNKAARSKIVQFNVKGQPTAQIEYNGLMDDIAVTKKTISILRSNQVITYLWDNTEISNLLLEQKPQFIVSNGKYVFCMDNSFLSAFTLLPK